jgi:polyisoprenoid-binding protein YceI
MAWTLDPHHTTVSFSAKHLGVATVRGHFNKVDGEIELDDPNDPTTARGTIVVDAASVDTGNEGRDNHLRNADFFDVERYPQIRFQLKRVEKVGDDKYGVVGDLSIHGVTREIALDYEHNGAVTDPYGNLKVGGSLTGTLNRSDWGLAWNVPLGGGGMLVSDKIKLEIDGELGQTKEAVAAGSAAEQTA